MRITTDILHNARALLSSAHVPCLGAGCRPGNTAMPTASRPDWLHQTARIADPILNVGANRRKGLEKLTHRAMARLIRNLATDPTANRLAVKHAFLEVRDAVRDLEDLHVEMAETSKQIVERLNRLHDAFPLAEKSTREAISEKAHEVELFLYSLRDAVDSATAIRDVAEQLTAPDGATRDVQPKAEVLRSAYEMIHDTTCKRLQRELDALNLRSANLSLRQLTNSAETVGTGWPVGQELEFLDAELTRLLEDLVKDIANLHFPGANKAFAGNSGIARLEQLLNQIEKVGDAVQFQRNEHQMFTGHV